MGAQREGRRPTINAMRSGAWPSAPAWALGLSAFAIAACGSKPPEKLRLDQIDEPGLCALISFDDASRALGAPAVGATDTSDHGALNPGCSWMAEAASRADGPRMLVFTVWRKRA